jgi:hypothetical protein
MMLSAESKYQCFCFCNSRKSYSIAKNRLRAMQHSAESICVVEYLRKYESIFETMHVAHKSVDPGILFDEKTRGRKSREIVPLMGWSRLISILQTVSEAKIVHAAWGPTLFFTRTSILKTFWWYYLNIYFSDGHIFVYSLHRYRYRYIVSNDRYKRTPSVICL